MFGSGRVVGGHYLNSAVAPGRGSELIVQTGFLGRKLNAEQVAEWVEVPTDSNANPLSAAGQAVAGVVLPRFMSKAASAAVGASIDATMRKPRLALVNWNDGKQSLIKLPDQLFTHLALMLKHQRREDTESDLVPANEVTPEPEAPPSLAEQALTHASDIVKGFLPARPSTGPAEPDLSEQLTKLAALRDQGILTDEEFATKKAELLKRF